jgi:hypothetical protein
MFQRAGGQTERQRSGGRFTRSSTLSPPRRSVTSYTMRNEQSLRATKKRGTVSVLNT